MPMKTTLLTRSGASRSSSPPPASSPRRSARAAHTTCSTISAVDMLRVRPGLAGGAERAVHAAAGLARDADGDPLGVAHEHRLDDGAVVQAPRVLHRLAVVGDALHDRASAASAAGRRRARTARPWAGRSSARDRPRAARSSASTAAWPGSPCAPAPPRPPCARPGVRSARCRGGLPRRGALKVSCPGSGRAVVGSGSATGAPSEAGAGVSVISPPVSQVESKRHDTTTPRAYARPPARRGPGSVAPGRALLGDAVAAVDDEHLAGDVGRLTAGEERDGRCHLVGGAGAPQRGRPLPRGPRRRSASRSRPSRARRR